MGILIMADFPNFGEGGDTALGRKRFEEMMRLAIQRDFNHPSIFAWCLFNETWGFGGQVEFVEFISPAPASKKLAERNPPPAALSGVKPDAVQATPGQARAKDAAEAATARLKLSKDVGTREKTRYDTAH